MCFCCQVRKATCRYGALVDGWYESRVGDGGGAYMQMRQRHCLLSLPAGRLRQAGGEASCCLELGQQGPTANLQRNNDSAFCSEELREELGLL